MTTPTTRKILAASFGTSDGAHRAASAVVAAHGRSIVNTAVIHVRQDGTPHYVETKDWGPGRGALLGAVIGLIGGPVGMLAGGGVGALASKLRDMGFKNDQLQDLGDSLAANESVVIFEMAAEATVAAAEMLRALDARAFVIEAVDANVATLFDGLPEPFSPVTSPLFR
ncbi:putative membrane protein [Microbacterium terrae]|uniref:DUF1269 domain-containing protein n=1 Tax=Microbacterium terrae TaxID=69369 RepID=A0A0M2HJK4_9MICO|nr:DUF1269 domain-containing protein [Microbacterium terrae]KJL44514.1 hypothetical protein RS81_00508 [Microbacterium terrae]MBP1079483.1 putative membrane protein [Microbacterium terrae]GLJ96823.1 hypothetical protein GCM10017594_00200 [Microbacterium terrae]